MGQGVYVGTQATVQGTAVLLGAGQCQGAAVQKADPKAPLPGPLAIIKVTSNNLHLCFSNVIASADMLCCCFFALLAIPSLIMHGSGSGRISYALN